MSVTIQLVRPTPASGWTRAGLSKISLVPQPNHELSCGNRSWEDRNGITVWNSGSSREFVHAPGLIEALR